MSMLNPDPCAHCGEEIPPTGKRGRPKRWCDDECRLAWRRAQPREQKPYSPAQYDRTCKDCGGRMLRGPGTSPQGVATCLACRRKRAGTEPKYKTFIPELRFCAVCSKPYETKQSTQRYCTPECRAHRRGQRTGKPKAPTIERGYGAEHRRERAKWKRDVVDKGLAVCCLCGEPIPPGSPFHLDHTEDRTGYRGVAHPRCNTSDGGRRGFSWKDYTAPTLHRSCATCGRAYETTYPRQRYCSKRCRPRARSAA